MDHGGSGRADPRLGAQCGLRGIAQAAQIAEPSQQILSDFDDILPLAAASEKDRKKLCVGERAWPASQQPFSRTSIRRKGKESRHRVSFST